MKQLTRRSSVAAACALIIVTNLVLLTSVSRNRRGEPAAKLTLTERELALPADRRDEGTGLSMSLVMAHEPPGIIRRAARWRNHELPAFDHEWLDRAKLLELGFRVDLEPQHPDAAEYYARTMPRRVLIVVEYEGDAWSRWIRGREEQVRMLRRDAEEGKVTPETLADAEALLAADQTMRSRLVAVDAGSEFTTLPDPYDDPHRHAVLAGFLRPKVVRRGSGAPSLGGEILDLVVDRVHIPRNYRRDLEPFLSDETWNEIEEREHRVAEQGWPSVTPARYRADLAVGNRHEPWLLDVSSIQSDEEATE